MATVRSQRSILSICGQAAIGFGHVVWQFVVAPIESVWNTVTIIVPFGWQTLAVGASILRMLHRHEPRRAGRHGIEPWDNAENARFVWREAREHWILWILRRLKVQMQTIGLERTDWTEGPYVLVSNHQSVMDIALIVSTLPHSAWFVAKKELLRWPIVGWVIGMTQIVIDREKGPEARKKILAAARSTSNLSVVVFAEGTRTADGELGLFKTGAAELAQEIGLPIVPIAIDGTRAALPKGFASLLSLEREPQVRITYGAPIPVSQMNGLDKKALMELVRTRIADMLRDG